MVLCLVLFAAVLGSTSLCAQRPPNSNAYYQQLRNLLPGGEVIAVHHLELKRDAAVFTFESGDISFYGEVNGKVTGAVFRGQGHLHLTPPTLEERHNLRILSHAEEFDEDFDQAVLRFTDKTAAELHQAGAGKGGDSKPLIQSAMELHAFQRLKLFENIDLRLLEDVLSPADGGFFMAAMHGKKNPHLIFTVDPDGARHVAPEEVSLLTLNDWGETYLCAFSSGEGHAHARSRSDSGAYRIDREDLDTTIEKSGFLTGMATLHVVAQQDGVAAARLSLFPSLRVSNVASASGEAMDFVQEKKEEDADFGVILPHALKKGEDVSIRITYGGKDVVTNEGNANYYPTARESWYPNAARGLGDYATYHMLFHVPKGLNLIATGTRVNETTDGRITTSEWKTDVPMPVVGFNLGRFTMKEGVLPGKLGDNLTIDAYANTTPPDEFENMGSAGLGNFNAPGMLPQQLSEGEAAAQIYTNYFGPLPYAKVALTQQFACDYGQSWPMLVYLPICGFLDSTQQHFMGLHPEDMYWKVVTAHEVAHQWWGQTVGFRSYRDQWMSEGFADASAAMFLQATRAKNNDFHEFWKQQRKLITEKNAQGFRPIDVGPVTMGFRLATEKTGWNVYQNLVYPKGAFILHMLRMMMWQPADGDARFREMMHDFVATYRLQAATTEDFKAIVEKHMTPGMDMDGTHTMDWFFRQYVYGTDLPVYHFESQVTTADNGGVSLHIKLVQSGVPDNFRSIVPIYLELQDGKVSELGSVRMNGNTTLEHTVALPKPPAPIKKVWINYNYDVLSLEN
ncbi:M1 family aminopeptidase [Terracidiphilus gabretensis]|uniref:M1 family aminopeptidase n=1 Tax=Terracidiphilus gabretensis TaxID=1577687 RepID=UPI00071B165F|nr:M1 family aminopeptidase [Terracidiphilus gabretensis]